MTSSSESPGLPGLPERVVRGDGATGAAVLATPDLRRGAWTRLGDAGVLGDAVTEHSLAGLAESARVAAQAQGYATGWGEGRRAAAELAAEAERAAEEARAAAEARRAEEHALAMAALTRAAAELQRTAARLAAELEDEALRLARELTAQIVGHEVRSSADPEGDVVRRALAVLPAGLPVTVRLHPAVAASAAARMLDDHDVTVRADATLGPADAVVETPTSIVDLGIEAALARVREALA
ncbi:flagellar assembly protein FliH [Nocardioides sp. TRM66260-LWL]|uniref:FliH/SctL family protein n=1 Tax=Nocardioides sp. TRM66260-LWL TaxID=2874478 RepID=UPI001CC69429|nr:FliH/SctL family protein [Nocardioides sp. TRM66260-LWL]MBZ5735181.1 flagellar assembly protein FliH [Nocardioides sp. TRM66260-LWL]